MTQAPTDFASPPVARPVAANAGGAAQPQGGPLSARDLQQLEVARQRGKRIRRAASVAAFNGWTACVFAAISLPCGIFSLVTFLLGSVLALVAYNELHGARGLRQFDETAPRRLGLGQLGLCAALVLYGGWGLYTTFSTPSPYEALLAGGAQATRLVGSIESLHTTVSLAMYGGLIGLSLIFQGGTAWYYFTRRRLIRAYVSDTPAWILELDRTASSP
jgi:hypothetical protein